MAPKLQWPPEELPATVHGTSVSIDGQGALIVGPSGAGKSSLALQLIALGARLISDDLTRLSCVGDDVVVSNPAKSNAPVQIEARGFGLLTAPSGPEAPLGAVIDLARLETARLPSLEQIILGKHPVRCFRKVDNPAFPAMVLLFFRQMQGG